MKTIDAKLLKSWIHDEHEIAVLDVREHGQYGENHLFFAVSLPYSVLELHVRILVPRKNTRIVVYADHSGESVVKAAAQALQRLGYAHIHILQGGIQAWQAAGYATFAGVYLPSKTFGELAEHIYQTPPISARQLYEQIQSEKSNLVILDGRPIQEYQKMNIPGSICCPNGELALRARQIAPDPSTTIVINCAGRTRSIIGAQTLINLGIPNPVYALENGTQGWYLSGYELEHQSDRFYPEQINPDLLADAKQSANNLLKKFELQTISFQQLKIWQEESNRTTYLFDVRTAQEYDKSQLSSAIRHAPGGQLIQATDEYIGVRKARIVLADFDQIRAPVIASWLKQLGWEVYLLADTDKLATITVQMDEGPVVVHSQALSSEDTVNFIKRYPQVSILDCRSSTQFRSVHLKHAQWVIRPTLFKHAPSNKQAPVLLLGTDNNTTALLATDMVNAGYQNIQQAIFNPSFFEAAGLPLERQSNVPPDAECIDFLFFVHDRHNGNKEAAKKYLEWETNLVSQIDEEERNTFNFNLSA
ncbi:sulfurtransferase [Advenella sp. WQ 585]|uniref:Sulfurtransferase n=1 Tax=Advenella mandrilli TaxID=2800330 RepID=A0ABS1E9I8_9BURK|nr:rhodanese-like domain-containing protein [Advenella mandrilli]MBK1780452.1 sulfurtransferase [Advenella mandrilli]MDY0271581.1 rhodanese-like domain-containing protein [Advenella sp.]